MKHEVPFTHPRPPGWASGCPVGESPPGAACPGQGERPWSLDLHRGTFGAQVLFGRPQDTVSGAAVTALEPMGPCGEVDAFSRRLVAVGGSQTLGSILGITGGARSWEAGGTRLRNQQERV